MNSTYECTCGLLRREFCGRAYSSWSLPRPGPRPRRYWRRRLVRPLVNTGDGGEATCSGSVALIAMLGLALLEAYYLPRQHSNNLIHDNEVASLWVMRASLPMLLWSWFICRTHFISRRSHLVLLIYGALVWLLSCLPTLLYPPKLWVLSAFHSSTYFNLYSRSTALQISIFHKVNTFIFETCEPGSFKSTVT